VRSRTPDLYFIGEGCSDPTLVRAAKAVLATRGRTTAGLLAAAVACSPIAPDILVDEDLPAGSTRLQPPAPRDSTAPKDPALDDPLPPFRPSFGPAVPTHRPRLPEGGVNLSLANASDVPRVVVPGADVAVRVRVENRGFQDTPPCRVRVELWRNSEEEATRRHRLGQVYVPALDAGGAYEHTASLRVPDHLPSIDFVVEATVDPDDEIEETDESDNAWLLGATQLSRVKAEPSRLVFPASGPGCTSSRTFWLENHAAEPVQLEPLQLVGADQFDFRLVGATAPMTLPPAKQGIPSRVAVEALYEPLWPARHRARVLIEELAKPSEPVVVELEGRSDGEPSVQDQDAQASGPSLDIVLAVARSPSMAAEITELRAFLPTLLTRLTQQQALGRIAVVEADASQWPGFVPAADPNALTSIESQLSARPSTEAHYDLLAAVDARLHQRPDDLRPDAGLMVVFVSDRDDDSPGPVGDYVRGWWDLKVGADAQLQANAIITNHRCPGAAPRLASAVAMTQGHTSAVCDIDDYAALWQLRDPRFGMPTRFPLDDRPAPNTLRVWVAGEPVDVASGTWSVDPDEPAVVFRHGFQPMARQSVAFAYVPDCR
jgi:hypothetical protein